MSTDLDRATLQAVMVGMQERIDELMAAGREALGDVGHLWECRGWRPDQDNCDDPACRELRRLVLGGGDDGDEA